MSATPLGSVDAIRGLDDLPGAPGAVARIDRTLHVLLFRVLCSPVVLLLVLLVVMGSSARTGRCSCRPSRSSWCS